MTTTSTSRIANSLTPFKQFLNNQGKIAVHHLEDAAFFSWDSKHSRTDLKGLTFDGCVCYDGSLADGKLSEKTFEVRICGTYTDENGTTPLTAEEQKELEAIAHDFLMDMAKTENYYYPSFRIAEEVA